MRTNTKLQNQIPGSSTPLRRFRRRVSLPFQPKTLTVIRTGRNSHFERAPLDRELDLIATHSSHKINFQARRNIRSAHRSLKPSEVAVITCIKRASATKNVAKDIMKTTRRSRRSSLTI